MFVVPRTIVIEAAQFTDDTLEGVLLLAGDSVAPVYVDAHGAVDPLGTETALLVRNKRGDQLAFAGDWIVRLLSGDLLVLPPHAFDLTYVQTGAANRCTCHG